MTSNDDRATMLARALQAAIDRDHGALLTSFTDDVRAWTPSMSTSSVSELIDVLDSRDDVFTDLELTVSPLDVGGDFACVEWKVDMTHSGSIVVAEDVCIEPSGNRITAHGVTVAEFQGDRICSLRQYWDEPAVIEQLVR